MALVSERFDEEFAPKELAEIRSFNHGYLQLKLGAYFLSLPNFIPSSELSLDISASSTGAQIDASELKPDIAVYREWSLDFDNDVLKAQAMPVLAIEILSPMQGVKTLVDKFHSYFALGIPSCWLVYPYARAIAVYHAPDQSTLFSQGDVVDSVVNIQMPLSEIFS